MQADSNTGKLSVLEKVGFGLGDTASNGLNARIVYAFVTYILATTAYKAEASLESASLRP